MFFNINNPLENFLLLVTLQEVMIYVFLIFLKMVFLQVGQFGDALLNYLPTENWGKNFWKFLKKFRYRVNIFWEIWSNT